MNKKLVLFALFLTAFVIYTRLQSHAPYLYSWDSVSFALSIDDFDMLRHQPHPPGYILYSYTLRCIDSIVKDPNLSMIYLNIAATLGACWFTAKLVFLLSKNEAASAGAAALYATNPVAWFYGSVAEIYAIEGFWVALIAYLVVASYERHRLLILASGMMALAGGFRPTTELLLLPLLVTAFLRKPRSIILSAIAVLIVGNLLWFWPLADSVGGVTKYIESVKEQSLRAAEAEPQGETLTFAKILLRVIQATTIPVLAALLLQWRKISVSLKESALLLAIVPPLILFSIFHFPKDGYLLVVIPILIGMVVLLLNKCIASRRVLVLCILAGCLLSVLGFLRPVKGTGMLAEMTQPNQRVLDNRMQRLRKFFEIVDGLGSGHQRTFVLENRHYFPSWRMLLYYYPDDSIYLIWPSKKRAYLGHQRKYETVGSGIQLSRQSGIIAVGKTAPALNGQLFQVDQYRYYFFEAGTLPPIFELYGMKFVVPHP